MVKFKNYSIYSNETMGKPRFVIVKRYFVSIQLSVCARSWFEIFKLDRYLDCAEKIYVFLMNV